MTIMLHVISPYQPYMRVDDNPQDSDDEQSESSAGADKGYVKSVN